MDREARDRAPFGATVWLTGLSAAGKSTLAAAVVARLTAVRRASRALDGDELRRTVSHDLGFERADRAEHARRVSDMALRIALGGEVAVVSLVSPHASDRELARAEHQAAGLAFVEVHVATPLDECERRDPKGLYARARRGEISLIAGLDYPYQPPAHPEVKVDLSGMTAEAASKVVLAALGAAGRQAKTAS